MMCFSAQGEEGSIQHRARPTSKRRGRRQAAKDGSSAVLEGLLQQEPLVVRLAAEKKAAAEACKPGGGGWMPKVLKRKKRRSVPPTGRARGGLLGSRQRVEMPLFLGAKTHDDPGLRCADAYTTSLDPTSLPQQADAAYSVEARRLTEELERQKMMAEDTRVGRLSSTCSLLALEHYSSSVSCSGGSLLPHEGLAHQAPTMALRSRAPSSNNLHASPQRSRAPSGQLPSSRSHASRGEPATPQVWPKFLRMLAAPPSPLRYLSPRRFSPKMRSSDGASQMGETLTDAERTNSKEQLEATEDEPGDRRASALAASVATFAPASPGSSRLAAGAQNRPVRLGYVSEGSQSSARQPGAAAQPATKLGSRTRILSEVPEDQEKLAGRPVEVLHPVAAELSERPESRRSAREGPQRQISEAQSILADLLETSVDHCNSRSSRAAGKQPAREADDDDSATLRSESNASKTSGHTGKQVMNVLLRPPTPSGGASAQPSPRKALVSLNGSMPWFPGEADSGDTPGSEGGMVRPPLGALSCKDSKFDAARVFHSSDMSRPRGISRQNSPGGKGELAPASPLIPAEIAEKGLEKSGSFTAPSAARLMPSKAFQSEPPGGPEFKDPSQQPQFQSEGPPQPVSYEAILAKIAAVRGAPEQPHPVAHRLPLRSSLSANSASSGGAAATERPSSGCLVPRLEMQKVVTPSGNALGATAKALPVDQWRSETISSGYTDESESISQAGPKARSSTSLSSMPVPEACEAGKATSAQESGRLGERASASGHGKDSRGDASREYTSGRERGYSGASWRGLSKGTSKGTRTSRSDSSFADDRSQASPKGKSGRGTCVLQLCCLAFECLPCAPTPQRLKRASSSSRRRGGRRTERFGSDPSTASRASVL